MKRKAVAAVLVVSLVFLFVAVLVNCGGGGSGGGGATTGTISGKVSNNLTGAAISGASVTDGTATVTTASDGTYTMSSVSPVSRKTLTISATGFAFTSKITAVVAGDTSRVDAALQPVASSTTLNSLATSQTVTVVNSTAQVALPPNSLVKAGGGAPTLPVTASITPIDPSSNPQLMPGDFTTSAGDMIESYGAMEVNFKDSTGASLNLASGQTATIRIPVAASSQGTAPVSMPAFFYNTTTGQWVQEGTLTLAGSAPNQYYEGTVSHFSYWNADMPYSTTCISGRVVNASGVPVANARIESQGRDYNGTAYTYTAGDGTFSVAARANSQVIVTASTSNALSNSEVVLTGAAGSTCTALYGDLTLGAIMGSAGSGSAKVRLTWGTDPYDLDSHLTGPNAANPGSRFHVYFSSMGDLTLAPFAALDVDDTSSYGPEVITLSKFTAGTYRYSVHHWSGSGTIAASPARIELMLNGSTTIFTPPAGTLLGVDDVWVVFELVVDAGGNATVNTINTYQNGVDSSLVTAPRVRGGAKPPIFGGNW